MLTLSPLARLLSAFRDRRGVAAVEFAFIAPVLILLYVGAGEVSQAAMTSRRLEALSRTLADLTSEQPTSSQSLSSPAPANATTQSGLQAILNAALAVMAPSPSTTLAMTVSAVDIQNDTNNICCVFKVRWSYTQNGALRPCGVNLQPVDPAQSPSATTVSNAMMPPVVSLSTPVPMLVADTTYTFTGPFAASWISFPTMHRTSYMLPRTPGQVILAGPISASGSQSGSICY